MRQYRRVLIIIVSVALAVGCATLPAIEKPEIRSVQPRVTGIDFHGVDLAFDVGVSNPYPVPIHTPRFRYGMDVEGSRFFDSEETARIDLPANKIGTTTLPVRVSYSDLMRQYNRLAGASEVNYTLNGAMLFPVMGRSFELPLSHSGSFPVLRPPTFSDISARVDEMSLSKARISLDANMRNPNAFPIDIGDLGYAAKTGDVEIGGLAASVVGALDPGQTRPISLSGEVSAASALMNLIKGGGLGGAAIQPYGSLKTPYGVVELQR